MAQEPKPANLLEMLRGLDDFRTINWAGLVQYPELVLAKSRELLDSGRC